jgi:hypothetical protein
LLAKPQNIQSEEKGFTVNVFSSPGVKEGDKVPVLVSTPWLEQISLINEKKKKKTLSLQKTELTNSMIIHIHRYKGMDIVSL